MTWQQPIEEDQVEEDLVEEATRNPLGIPTPKSSGPPGPYTLCCMVSLFAEDLSKLPEEGA